MSASFDREIVLRPQVFLLYAVVGDRLLTVERGPPGSRLTAEIWSFDGEQLRSVKRLGVVPTQGYVASTEVLLVGGGKAVLVDAETNRVDRWSQPPEHILTMARHGGVLALVEYRGSDDPFAAVVWDSLAERPTKRLARLAATPSNGWRRPPYFVHPLDERRWWLFSEHRFALVELVEGQVRVVRSIDVAFIACQVLLVRTGVFALEVRGGLRQWRDGKPQWATSSVLGGTPPDPQIAVEARLFHVDLESGRADGPSPMRAGMLCTDASGAALVHAAGVDRIDGSGRIVESLPMPVPDPRLQEITLGGDDVNCAAVLRRYNFAPGEILLTGPGTQRPGDSTFEQSLHHLAWGPAVERARARYREAGL